MNQITFREILERETASRLVSFSDAVRSGPDEPVRAVAERMRARKTGCALVCENERLVGILTDRDVLRKVIPEGRWDLPVRDVMTANPDTIRPEEPLAEVVRRMARGHYRHLPMVDAAGRPLKTVSVRGLVRHLAEHFPIEVYNLPPNPDRTPAAPEGA